jgi:hypothetical protein
MVQNGSGIRLDDSSKDPEQRGLAGPVTADDAEGLSPMNVQADAIQGLETGRFPEQTAPAFITNGDIPQRNEYIVPAGRARDAISHSMFFLV